MKMLEVFESRTCPRCGGSGNYSYTWKWGHTCFQCGVRPHQPGSGRVLTKRGAAAYEFYHSLQPRKKARDLQVGEVIRSGSITADGNPYEAWYKIVEIKHDHRKTGASLKDGQWIDTWGDMDIAVARGSERLVLSGVTYDGEYLMQWPDAAARQEAIDKALAYQATLTKAGTPRKTRKKQKVQIEEVETV